MNRSLRAMLLTVASLALLADSTDLMAQANNGANRRRAQAQRDPAQAIAQRMDRYRQQLEITNDEEWKVLQPRIEKVVQVQGELRVVRFGANLGRRGNGPQAAGTNSPGRVGRSTQGSNPEVEALQAAAASKLAADEMKAQLAKFRAAQKAKETALAKHQEELRKLLSVRQEAIAVLIGLLP